MTEPAYPPARAVALKILPHFARHLAADRQYNQRGLAPQPEAQDIEAIVDAAFWASLRRIEGYVPTISLAFVPPEQEGRPLKFERSFPLAAEILTQLAPAVERPGIHLGVWRERDGLRVWGTTRMIPMFCFVLEVVAPGLLVIKHRRSSESTKFVNLAVLEGDQIKVIKHDAESPGHGPAILGSLLGFESPGSPADSFNVFVELAVSMRAHGRGGSLLVVPEKTDTWRESIIRPVPYSVLPPFSELADLVREQSREDRQRLWHEALRRVIESIAGLTAVDGATVITDQYELLAFGAKIGRRQGSPRIEHVVVTEPIDGSRAEIANPGQLGGTRHLSAAQFGQDQRDAFALVASQDRRFTVFAWSPREEMVHAHRVEALLL
jgi:hypothetical protein